jgi:hypothetical protein
MQKPIIMIRRSSATMVSALFCFRIFTLKQEVGRATFKFIDIPTRMLFIKFLDSVQEEGMTFLHGYCHGSAQCLRAHTIPLGSPYDQNMLFPSFVTVKVTFLL